jgi:hypothetical protein
VEGEEGVLQGSGKFLPEASSFQDRDLKIIIRSNNKGGTMKLRFLLCCIIISLFFTGASLASEDNKSGAGGKTSPARADTAELLDVELMKVVRKTLGQKGKILKAEPPEKSPLKGISQIRVWFESAYGETPVLFYVTEGKKHYIAGTIYDSQGNNLTRKDVGNTIPKKIEESELMLNDDYRIGNENAEIKIALWIGVDQFSKVVFENFYSVYDEHKDKISLYIKFYPSTEENAKRMSILTCFKGEKGVEIYNKLHDVAPGWGSDQDIEDFLKKNMAENDTCDPELLKKDVDLSKKLKLPLHPVIFINGVLYIDEIKKDKIKKHLGL